MVAMPGAYLACGPQGLTLAVAGAFEQRNSTDNEVYLNNQFNLNRKSSIFIVISQNMNDLINLFTPIRFLKFIKEFFIYVVRSLFRYWIYFFTASATICSLYYFSNALKVLASCWYYILLVPVLFTTIMALIDDFKRKKNTKQFTAAEMECVYVTENDHFEKKMVTEKLNEDSKLRIKDLFKNSFPFLIGLANYRLIRFPKFYYYLLSPNKLNSLIKRKVDSGEVQCVLLPLIDEKTSKITFIFFSKEGTFNNIKVIHDLTEIASRIEVKERDLENFIENIMSFYQSVVAHGFMDMTIDANSFTEAHRLLDENQQNINRSLNTIKNYATVESKTLLNDIEEMWNCEIERYRAIVYMLTENYNSALIYIFKAIKLCPYYPFSNYQSWKEELIKTYVISFAKALETAQTEFDLESGNSSDEIDSAIQSITSQLSFPGIKSYTDLIIEINNRAESSEIATEIERYLQTTICESPMQEYIKGEVNKFLPLEGDMYDELYMGRIDSSQKFFEKVIEIDLFFPAINNKIGALMMIKQIGQGKTEPRDFDDAVTFLRKGFEIFSKYGLNVKKK